MEKNPIIIGISGGSGAGKTTICKRICLYHNINFTLLNHDSYYKCLSHLSVEERSQNNFDHPAAFDNSLLYEHLTLIKNAHSVNVPEYYFITHTRTNKIKQMYPTEVVLIEGILLFSDSRVRACLDHKIFINLDSDIRFIRRLKRDITTRGRTLNSVVDQYFATTRPMHNKYVEPFKAYADIIIDGMSLEIGANLIIDYIKSKIEVK